MLEMELGPFLRSRRDAVKPEEVGLPAGPRRRTPGLRRSEVATLAGISVDYLVRIEQGRDRNPSSQVIAALAQALRLGPDDQMHLRKLVAVSQGAELCPEMLAAARIVRPTVRAVLEQLEPAPALVLNHLAEVLAWTTTYERVARPIGLLDADPPSLIRFTFTDPRARTAYPAWEQVADEQIANLRAHLRFSEGQGAQLVEELAAEAGAAFTERWEARPVQTKRFGVKRLVHPEVGELRLSYETLQLPDEDDQRLVVYLPADDATGQALDRLSGRLPGGLRAVADATG
jgi:transcriptional regulator with XRE-family HTH domain